VRQDGDVFEIDYDGGARLRADVGRNRWTWTRSGVTYDGFTPFNARGYMAVLRTGEFSLRIPGRHRLEIAAGQPNRAQIPFAWRHEEDTVVEGRLDPDSWSLPTSRPTRTERSSASRARRYWSRGAHERANQGPAHHYAHRGRADSSGGCAD
jgi:hypothetical protein